MNKGFTPIPRQIKRNTYAKRSTRLVQGFTMIEAVITLAIITVISGMVLVSFSGFNEGAALNRDSRGLALAIRKAQNMSLVVTQIQTQAGPKIPPAVGVGLSTIQSGGYFIFADLVNDNEYNALNDALIETGTFDRNIKVQSLTDELGNSHTIVNVVFSAPEAAVTLSDASGVSIGNKVDIVLQAPSGPTKKITVRTSGQINIQ